MYDTIYLVDDMPMVNLFHEITLRNIGIEKDIRSFTDPEKALDDLRFKNWHKKRALVLLDINMPVMTGFEFLEFMVLEKLSESIDVVIVSASNATEDRELAGSFPQYVNDYLPKPLQKAALSQIFNTSYAS